MPRISQAQSQSIRGIWSWHQQGYSADQIVGLLAAQRIRVSRYQIEQILLACTEQAEKHRAVAPEEDLDLLGFIPKMQPKYQPPLHLLPLIQKLELALTEPVRAVVHAPPRHGKTETILAAMAYWLKKRLDLTIGYATYGQHLSFSKSRKARELVERCGIDLKKDANNLAEWRTAEDGGLLATSVDGPFTGHGVGILVIDDPIKGRAEAESRTIRESVWDWFSSVSMTRVEPGGSVFIIMTRWHEQDLAGRLLREQGKHTASCQDPMCQGCGPMPEGGYEEIRLPAISDEGEALWEARWPKPALELRRKEVGEFTWSSLYQGRPRPRGGKVFESTYFYEALPSTGFTIVIGVDLAYTEKTTSDWSVAVALARVGSGQTAIFYVLEVLRRQVPAPKFAENLRKMRQRHYNCRIVSIYYGTETGTIDFMRAYRPPPEEGKPQITTGLPITAIKKTGDKLVRSQSTAAAWNNGRILVPNPRDHAWVDPFVEVICDFTGVKDLCDDDVDALVAAFEGAGGSAALMDEAAALKLGEALAGANSSMQRVEGVPEATSTKRPGEPPLLALGSGEADEVEGWCSIE